MERLKIKYNKEVVPALMEKYKYPSVMAVPRLEKVVLNTGFGRMVVSKEGAEAKKSVQDILLNFADIAGQKPALTKAKKSISTFKLREGMGIGAKVTLRNGRMYEFLDRLVAIVLPRTRDFQGLDPKAIDSKGNMTIGIREHLFFPEVSPEKSHVPFGLEITVATTAKTREEGEDLFRLLGFPLK